MNKIEFEVVNISISLFPFPPILSNFLNTKKHSPKDGIKNWRAKNQCIKNGPWSSYS